LGKRARKTAVQFAPMTELRFYTRIDDSFKSKCWYSKEEFRAMRKEFKLGAQNLLMRCTSLSSNKTEDECDTIPEWNTSLIQPSSGSRE